MEYRPYGKEKKLVSRLGFGGWQLGNQAFWNASGEDESIALVEEAIRVGVNFFDTAPGYSNGASERILGRGIVGNRERVVINTKFGHHADGTTDFSETRILDSITSSLGRLNTNYLDSLILHNPKRMILEGKTNHFNVLNQLKMQGVIRNFGVSIDTKDELQIVLDRLDVDVVEIMFNIFHQEPSTLFDHVLERGISLIIKVPLDSGWLTGKYHENSVFTGIRSRWTQELIQRRGKLVSDLKAIVNEDQITKYAIAFIVGHPAVTTVIPGIKSIAQLHEHVENESFVLPLSIKEKFIHLYDQKIKTNDLGW